MNILKKFISYLIPITVYKKKSDISKRLELTWVDGVLHLDAKNVNYSYGSLQRILRFGLKQIGFETIRNMTNILILGVAGGSVVKTLINEIGFKNEILGIEIDPEIITLARQFYAIDEFKNFHIKIEDAKDFVSNNQKAFDLVIIDIFEDNLMPDFLFRLTFWENLLSPLAPGGIILLNTLTQNLSDKNRNKMLRQQLTEHFPIAIQVFSDIETTNELILITLKENTFITK